MHEIRNASIVLIPATTPPPTIQNRREMIGLVIVRKVYE